jgi:hypothetical protein
VRQRPRRSGPSSGAEDVADAVRNAPAPLEVQAVAGADLDDPSGDSVEQSVAWSASPDASISGLSRA